MILECTLISKYELLPSGSDPKGKFLLYKLRDETNLIEHNKSSFKKRSRGNSGKHRGNSGKKIL